MPILVDDLRKRRESHVSLRAYQHYTMEFGAEAQRKISVRITKMIREGREIEKGIEILGGGNNGAIVCAVEHKGFWVPVVYSPEAECLVTVFARGTKWDELFYQAFQSSVQEAKNSFSGEKEKLKTEQKQKNPKRLKFYDE